MTGSGSSVRIDKWLWAARFFKTRRLAKDAIDGGKIHCDGQRVKSAKEISPGITLSIRQGFDEKTVVVTGVADQRRGAPEAALMYEETAESVAARKKQAAERKAANAGFTPPKGRPDKKSRRQIHRFRTENDG